MTDWETYRKLRLVANVSLRQPSTGETVCFRAGDDPPEWARRLMGPHVYGLDMPTEPFTWGDGLPTRIDLVCNEQRNHRRPRPKGSFEAALLLEHHDVPRFLWTERRAQNTRQDGVPTRWGPNTQDSAGRVHPGAQVDAPWEASCCGLKLETNWGWLCEVLDKARALGESALDLRRTVYAKTRKL